MTQSEKHSIQPISTCLAENCKDCSLSVNLSCHFSLFQHIKFMISALPGFLLGAVGINRIGNYFLIPWILFCVIFFGIIEIRVLCSHCPHYGEPGISLRCRAAWGLLKLWKWRLGPMSAIEKIILLGGFSVIWIYPLPFLIIGSRWFLLLAYTFATLGFFGFLNWQFCRHCINIYCPLNSVPDNIKNELYKQNPALISD